MGYDGALAPIWAVLAGFNEFIRPSVSTTRMVDAQMRVVRSEADEIDRSRRNWTRRDNQTNDAGIAFVFGQLRPEKGAQSPILGA